MLRFGELSNKKKEKKNHTDGIEGKNHLFFFFLAFTIKWNSVRHITYDNVWLIVLTKTMWISFVKTTSCGPGHKPRYYSVSGLLE